MIKLKIIAILISMFSCSSSFQKATNKNDFLNRLYIEESGLQFFKVISKDSVMWVSTGDVGYVKPTEKKYPYSLQNQELKVFKTFSDGEKETLVLRWNSEGDYFIEDEFDLVYRRTKSVIYGTRKYD